jgi:hypothetical protein
VIDRPLSWRPVARIITLAENRRALTRAPVGEDAENILQQVREKSTPNSTPYSWK